MVVLVRVAFRVSNAVVFSGFSGTVAESLVVSILGSDLHDATLKPVSVTPFFLNGKPVLDKAAVPPGGRLEFRVGMAYSSLAEKPLQELPGVKLFGVGIDLEEVEVRHVLEEPPPDVQCFKINFLTPTRFSTPAFYKRKNAVFDFLPRPLSLFKSAVKHGRGLGLVKLGAPFLKWIYTYVALTDFGCISKSCVKTVKLPGGGIARGFVGWGLYKSFNKRRVRNMWTVLKLMEVFNVGTGRGMGLGVVKITPIQCANS